MQEWVQRGAYISAAVSLARGAVTRLLVSARNSKKSKDTAVDRDASIATSEYPSLRPHPRVCLSLVTFPTLSASLTKPSTDELRKRVEEAEAQLREEAKIIERMTRENKSKQEQISSMEALLQREIEKHQATIRMLEDEHLTQKLQAEHESAVLTRKVSELELHVEAYNVVECANATLRDRVDKLMQQLEHDNKNHAEEIHKVRLDMFNHKMALEKVSECIQYTRVCPSTPEYGRCRVVSNVLRAS